MYRKYIDKEFPAKLGSICEANHKDVDVFKRYNWTRAFKIKELTEDQIFEVGFQKLQPSDVENLSTYLENQQFMTCLILIASKPNFVYKMFSPVTEDSYNFGVFEIAFYADGQKS